MLGGLGSDRDFRGLARDISKAIWGLARRVRVLARNLGVLTDFAKVLWVLKGLWKPCRLSSVLECCRGFWGLAKGFGMLRV